MPRPARFRQAVIFTLALALFLLLTLVVTTHWSPLLDFDQAGRAVVNAHRTPGLTTFLTNLTHLYDQTGTIVIALLIVVGCFIWRGLNTSLQALVTITTGNFLNHLVKGWIARPRPDGQVLLHYAGWSFPSGHSAGVMVTAGFLILLVLRTKWPTGWRHFIATLLGILILLIGFSRIYVGAHFPSDVLGGWLLGVIVVSGVDLLFCH